MTEISNSEQMNPTNLADDAMHRPEGCVCTYEVGDSDCPVHPTCSYCGAEITYRAGTPIYSCNETCPEPSFHGTCGGPLT